jgi:5-hydroxyisourate hydrolase-like protein (transthyretin family)
MILACVRPAVAAVLDGRVLEDHNGTPVPRVEILIASPHDAAIVAELETDSQGRFRTPDLPNAEYVLRFSKTNFATFEVTTAPRSGMQMRMVRFGVIDGRIFESDGSPALNPAPRIATAVRANTTSTVCGRGAIAWPLPRLRAKAAVFATASCSSRTTRSPANSRSPAARNIPTPMSRSPAVLHTPSAER